MPETQVHAAACPKCFGPLDADTFWCRACYFKQLNEPDNPAPVQSAVAAGEVLPVNSVRCAAAFVVSLLSVVTLSVLSHSLFAPGSAERFWYSVCQVATGTIAFVASHFASYVHGLRYTDDVDVGDVLNNPLGVWRSAIADLPDSWKRVTTGVAGMLAVFLGVTIVDGVSIDHLIGERDFPGRPNVLNFFVEQAAQSGKHEAAQSDMSLEQAIEEFAGHGTAVASDSAGTTESVEVHDASESDVKPYDPRNTDHGERHRPDVTTRPAKRLRCVILGFVPGGADGVSGLALGAIFNGRLQFAGIVTHGVEANITDTDVERLGELLQTAPSIPCSVGDIPIFWVRPAVTCDVKCRTVNADGQLVGPVFDHIRAATK